MMPTRYNNLRREIRDNNPNHPEYNLRRINYAGGLLNPAFTAVIRRAMDERGNHNEFNRNVGVVRFYPDGEDEPVFGVGTSGGGLQAGAPFHGERRAFGDAINNMVARSHVRNVQEFFNEEGHGLPLIYQNFIDTQNTYPVAHPLFINHALHAADPELENAFDVNLVNPAIVNANMGQLMNSQDNNPTFNAYRHAVQGLGGVDVFSERSPCNLLNGCNPYFHRMISNHPHHSFTYTTRANQPNVQANLQRQFNAARVVRDYLEDIEGNTPAVWDADPAGEHLFTHPIFHPSELYRGILNIHNPGHQGYNLPNLALLDAYGNNLGD